MDVIWLILVLQGFALFLAAVHIYELRKKVKDTAEKLYRLTDEVYTIIHVDNEQTKGAIVKLDRRLIGSLQQFEDIRKHFKG